MFKLNLDKQDIYMINSELVEEDIAFLDTLDIGPAPDGNDTFTDLYAETETRREETS